MLDLIPRMNTLASTLLIFLAVEICYAAEAEFNYINQNLWGGVCTTGSEMSPIDIDTSEVVVDSSLTELQFNDWDTAYAGTFGNNGHSVQFDPDTPGAATTVNFLGTYSLQQFHMHWGRRTGEGSEHRIDGSQAELEIHFVHTKVGTNDTSQRDYITVIGVLVDVDDEAELTSPWAELNVSMVQSNSSDGVSVSRFIFSNLLPENRDYYYYPGSLTTPLCNETVQWFVMKERITVPGSFLEKLREVQDSDGEPLEFNFRDAQDLGDRTVMTASQAVNKPFMATIILCLLSSLIRFFSK